MKKVSRFCIVLIVIDGGIVRILFASLTILVVSGIDCSNRPSSSLDTLVGDHSLLELAPVDAACTESTVFTFSLEDPREISIQYYYSALPGNVIFLCDLIRSDTGDWESTNCSMCDSVYNHNTSCPTDNPKSLDGKLVGDVYVASLLDVVSELQLVDKKTSCFWGTDNDPDYDIIVKFAVAGPLVITNGSNCGPFFATQSGNTGCDCGHGMHSALWSIFNEVAPQLLAEWEFAPDHRCSCETDFP